MEDQLVQILSETQSSAEAPRRAAEEQLQQQYTNEAFPIGLASIASHNSVSLPVRQAALLALKNYVLATWSPLFDEFQGQILLREEAKAPLRDSLLDLALSPAVERKVQNAAALVVSKIAAADFPDDWSGLLSTLIRVIPDATDAQLHGALKVLAELVDDGFNEDQFFKIAKDMMGVLYSVAGNEARKPILRALAVSVFRGCFDILEMVMEDHKAAVKTFAEETISGWMPFYLSVLKMELPQIPPTVKNEEENSPQEAYRGLVALKLQVVKVLMRIRSVFPSILTPQSPALFQATWTELSTLQPTYQATYVDDDQEGRLEDSDGLPYTLDFLILEDLDFMQACIRAPPVRKELQQELNNQAASAGDSQSTWVLDMIKIATLYAQITTEEEGMWQIDVNVFLSEETSVTANYTARTACGDLLIKLGEWLSAPTIQALLNHTKALFASDQSWRAKEAVLFVVQQVLTDWQDTNRSLDPETLRGFLDPTNHAMQQQDIFLRARGYLVASHLVKSAGPDDSGEQKQLLDPHDLQLMEATLRAIVEDSSDVVQAACIRATQQYLQTLPPAKTVPFQISIMSALSQWLAAQDPSDLTESDDLLMTLVETLRDAILLHTRICIEGDGLNILFTVASQSASNYQISQLITETFEEIASTIASLGSDAYMQLCQKTLPSLTDAFNVGNLTEENALVNLAAELLASLAQHGTSPLPEGFIPAVLPKLHRFLTGSSDDELLRACTSAVKHIVAHDMPAVLAYQDPDTGKGGLEIVLIIIDRLLSPDVDDGASAEVGGLAAEVVERAGHDQLGPYLMQLLQAVAVRLATATQAHLIQSLITVFARLCLTSAREVVDFLAQVQVADTTALHTVLPKWLENSINFVGYSEIRINVLALAELYKLHDPRLMQVSVKGDLIVPTSDRIVTRSRARANPDQYTSVAVPLKIIKVLVDELSNASGANAPNLDGGAISTTASNVAIDGDDNEDGGGSDDDDEWEDDPNELDLGLPSTKAELMAFANEDPSAGTRQRDDETQAYLVEFFRSVGQDERFGEIAAGLNEGEREKLGRLG